MPDLDDKLLAFLGAYQTPEQNRLACVRDIKSVFEEAGYRIPIGVTVSEKTVRRTGKEWLAAFEKELRKKNWKGTEKTRELVEYNQDLVLEAAKRASGVSDE